MSGADILLGAAVSALAVDWLWWCRHRRQMARRLALFCVELTTAREAAYWDGFVAGTEQATDAAQRTFRAMFGMEPRGAAKKGLPS